MATFSLTDLKNEVSKKYAPTIIENGSDEFVLQNILQLSPAKRNEVLEIVDTLDDEIEDGSNAIEVQMEKFRELIIAAEDNDRGEELVELIGENAALLIEIATKWMETTQLGEAGRS